jgi:hypothetical protein
MNGRLGGPQVGLDAACSSRESNPFFPPSPYPRHYKSTDSNVEQVTFAYNNIYIIVAIIIIIINMETLK